MGTEPETIHRKTFSMKKVKLVADALRVESFEPMETNAKGGTVFAREATHPFLSDCAHTCDDCPTVYSCNLPFNCA